MSKKLSNAPVLKTEVVSYQYNFERDEERRAYKQMSEEQERDGKTLMRVHSLERSSNRLKSGLVLIDTSCLFDNQWNTTEDSPCNPKHRIFDWYEQIVPNKNVRMGHYTVITDQMRELQDKVVKCGFCGNHEWAEEAGHFCDQCIGSPYLSSAQVHLLLLLPVRLSFGADRKAFIESGRYGGEEALEEVRQSYEAAQIQQDRIQAEMLSKEVVQKYEDELEKITIERDGMLWLLEKGINVENCIFYPQKKTFAFGWRQSLSPETRERLVSELKEFPFKVEFK